MGYKMTTYKKKQEMMAILHLGGRRPPCPLPPNFFCRGYKATIAGEILLKNVTTGLRKRREKVRFIEFFARFLRDLSRNRADLTEISSILTFKCVFLAFFCQNLACGKKKPQIGVFFPTHQVKKRTHAVFFFYRT